MNAPQNPGRRQWFRKVLYGLVGTALAAFGALLADVWRAAGRFSTDRWTEVAPLSAVAAEGATPFPRERIAILRREGRLAALSLECTHLGCLVNAVDQGFYCPCHGSEFGPQGEVWSGPATVPLPWHAVRIVGGRVWIRTGEKLEEPVWVDL